jgi:hypothetical protein
MSIPKVGSAPSPKVSPSPNSVQEGSKLQGPPGPSKTQGLEVHNEAVEGVAQHLAADTSLKNPGQVRDQAQSLLSDLTGLGGKDLQELVRRTMDRVHEIQLSSGDRWLRGPTTGDQGDIFTVGTGTPSGGKLTLA